MDLFLDTWRQHVDEHSRAKQIIYVNQIALTFMVASLPFVLSFFILGHAILASIALPFIAMFFICLALNHFQYHQLAQLTLIFAIIIPTYIYSYLFYFKK